MMNIFTKTWETTPVKELGISEVEMLIRDNPLKDQILFGSNVYKVLNHINSPAPVLIVPEKASFENMMKIAYATDLRSSDIIIINYLKNLSAMLQAELLIAHVSSDTIEYEQAISKKITDEVLSETTNKNPSVKYFQNKNIENSLNEIIEQENIGMLAMHIESMAFLKAFFM